MILLLHGENTLASRDELVRIKTEYKLQDFDIVEVGQREDNIDLLSSSSQKNLFGKASLYILENFWNSKKHKTFIPPFGVNIVFYEDRKLVSLPKIAQLEVLRFDYPQIIFKFLESLEPAGQKQFLPLFYELEKVEISEIIFSMLARQTRLLLLTKLGAPEGPTEWLNLAPWQRQRLTRQAAKFSLENLFKLHNDLVKLDFESKSGTTALDLTASLELLLLKL